MNGQLTRMASLHAWPPSTWPACMHDQLARMASMPTAACMQGQIARMASLRAWPACPHGQLACMTSLHA
eukprot:28437-Chlamydomonas_euryale.AAC.11